MLPDFVLVGTMRSGSTYLFNLLRKHQQVFIPSQKELRYFSDSVGYGGSINLEEYGLMFSDAEEVEGLQAVGEMSPEYMFFDWVPELLAKNLPDLKLIITLRNPSIRAYSHYWHTLKGGYDEYLTFEQSFKKEKGRITSGYWERNRFSYFERGFYFRQINRLLQYFDRERIFIILLDEMVMDPLLTINNLCAFLDVDRFNSLPIVDRNQAKIPKYVRLYRILTYLRIRAKRISHSKGIWRLHRLVKLMQSKIPVTTEHPQMSKRMNDRLSLYYREENRKLFDFLGRQNYWE